MISPLSRAMMRQMMTRRREISLFKWLLLREKVKRRIPLCHLVPMPMIRPMLSCDLTKLEQQFSHGYEDGARVFYVSFAHEQGQMGEFTEDEKRE